MTVLFVSPASADVTPLDAIAGISAHVCDDPALLLVYADDDAAAAQVAAALPDATRHDLAPLSRIAGAGAGMAAPAHYVVWTDVAEGWWDEMGAWYGEEHLPGLASVPGAVRARRFEQTGDGPRHYACYDLSAPEVLGSPPWLKVRATDWSSRVRPNFRNTRRWMCRTLFDTSGDRP